MKYKTDPQGAGSDTANEPQIEVRRRKSPYTNVQNALIWDKNLRPQTRWMLIAMLSLPEDWDYSIRGLAHVTGMSKDTIAKMMTELEQAGYLMRKAQSHAGKGRFSRTMYILTDVPYDFGEDNTFADESPDDPLDEIVPEDEIPSDEQLGGDVPCPNLPYTVAPYTESSPQQNNKQQTNKQQNPVVPRQRKVKPTPEIEARILEYAPRDAALQDAVLGLLENRQVACRKPVKTLRALNGILRDLDKHSGGNRDLKFMLLEKAILSNWLTVYPLKEDEIKNWPKQTGDAPAQGQPLRGEGVTYL